VLEDGVPQTITDFSQTQAPITAAILVEFSGDTFGLFQRDSLVSTFTFVQTLKKDDWVALISYDIRPHILTDFTQNKREVMGGLSTLSIAMSSESNLYDALDAAIPDSFLPMRQRVALAWAIADVYDWEVDFTRDLRPGDRVEVLLERLQSPEGERRFGRILAARVDVAGSPSFAFAYQNGFYDDRGRSLRRAFLRAPLRFSHISSRFGGRFHPILKRWRTHQGTDYAAGYGTPVRATADGIVTEAGRNGGYGNLVEIRHANGIRTRYGHLSRFATGLRAGQRVRQEQVIGYVGATGLATGPHLHYEFLVNGRPTNPQRKDAGAGEPVASKLKSQFDDVRAQLLAELEPTGIPNAAAAFGSAAAPARDD